MAEPITVTEAANFLRLDTTTSPIPEQALLSGIITAARKAAEAFTNRTIVERQRVESFDAFETVIPLPNGDVSSVDTIAYVDSNGVDQTVADSILSKNRVTPAYGESWPDARDQLGAVTITYTAGYTDGSVPEPIIQAIYLIIGDMYENRAGNIQGAEFRINPTVQNLLMPYRIDMGV